MHYSTTSMLASCNNTSYINKLFTTLILSKVNAKNVQTNPTNCLNPTWSSREPKRLRGFGHWSSHVAIGRAGHNLASYLCPSLFLLTRHNLKNLYIRSVSTMVIHALVLGRMQHLVRTKSVRLGLLFA